MTEKILTFLVPWITGIISHIGYPGVAPLMAIESACIPLPSEIIMPFAGYLVYTGRFSLFWVATAGAIGCNFGSAVAYWIGAYGGRPLVESIGSYILLDRRDLDRTTKFFRRYGPSRFCWPPAARGAHIYRAAGWHRPHAATEISYLHFCRFLALVSCLGLCRYEAGQGVEHRSSVEAYPSRVGCSRPGCCSASALAWFIWTHWKRRPLRNRKLIDCARD